MTFDLIAELREALARLDADIDAGRFSRTEGIAIAERMLDRLHEIMVERSARRLRRLQ
jgi:hypothetical protein